MDHASRTAIQARRFRLLASDPKHLSASRAVRARAIVERGELSAFDALLVGGASESDRLCGSAVRLLQREDESVTRTVLELLAPLPAEYLLGVYHAIPRDRQFPLRRALYELGRTDCLPMETIDVETAMESVEVLATDPVLDLDGDEAEEMREVSRAMLARRLGLDADLSPEAELAVEVADALMASAFGDQ